MLIRRMLTSNKVIILVSTLSTIAFSYLLSKNIILSMIQGSKPLSTWNNPFSHALSERTASRSEDSKENDLYMVIVYVPTSHADVIRTVLAKERAGTLETDNYDSCSFSITGESRFRPLEGADPFQGKIGVLEITSEEKIEVVVLKKYLKNVLIATKKAHPYEKPYILVHKVINYEEFL